LFSLDRSSGKHLDHANRRRKATGTSPDLVLAIFAGVSIRGVGVLPRSSSVSCHRGRTVGHQLGPLRLQTVPAITKGDPIPRMKKLFLIITEH
jgi:hypothetical protein